MSSLRVRVLQTMKAGLHFSPLIWILVCATVSALIGVATQSEGLMLVAVAAWVGLPLLLGVIAFILLPMENFR